MFRALVCASAALGALGCQLPEEDVSTTRQEIFNGTEDTNEDHAAVVALTYATDGEYFCTGTLIKRSVVLTAGHCLEGIGANEVSVFFGNDTVAADGEYRDIDEIEIHPDYDPDELLADIALIRLDKKSPEGVSAIPALPKSKKLTEEDGGAEVEFSGFGLTESGDEGIKLRVDGTITLVCDSEPCVGGLVVPKSHYYSMASGGPCVGDSGGPTFIRRDSKEYVAGVTSYGDFGCTEYGVNTTVSAYSGWIGDFVDDGGCSIGSASHGRPTLWLMMAVLVAVMRRRRRSSPT